MRDIFLPSQSRIFVAGASGDLGIALIEELIQRDIILGAHYFCHPNRLKKVLSQQNNNSWKLFSGNLSKQAGCRKVLRDFYAWSGGIDYFVQMSGGISSPQDWNKVKQGEWDFDLAVNLSGPFFLAQEAMTRMKKNGPNGGKIILMSTASASHGGGRTSLAYGAAKAAVECVAKGLARIGGEYNIKVNAVAPGFILTKLHTKAFKRTKKQLEERAKLTTLKRAGTPQEVAGIVMMLLSKQGDYMTGQVINIDGGDWI